MRWLHGSRAGITFVVGTNEEHIKSTEASNRVFIMRLFSLSFLKRTPRFHWAPSVDLSDRRVAAALITFSGN